MCIRDRDDARRVEFGAGAEPPLQQPQRQHLFGFVAAIMPLNDPRLPHQRDELRVALHVGDQGEQLLGGDRDHAAFPMRGSGHPLLLSLSLIHI